MIFGVSGKKTNGGGRIKFVQKEKIRLFEVLKTGFEVKWCTPE